VVAGLLFIGTIGAGTYAALTVSANLLMSLAIDHFGWLRVAPHPITPARAAGALILIIGVVLITSN
jgi:transporter family-2 protein